MIVFTQIDLTYIHLFRGQKKGVESLNLNIGFEYLLEEPLNPHQDESGDEEDVGKVEGELAKGLVSAVRLDIVYMVPWVYSSVGC